MRTWLYRIATNVCIDMGRSPQRRARPVDLGPARTPDPVHLADVLPDDAWITPIPDASVIDVGADPAEVAAARDSIRLAFVSALAAAPRDATGGARALRRAAGGRRRRSPTCSTRHPHRSTARCSAPGRRSQTAPASSPTTPLSDRPTTPPRPLRRCVRALRHGRPRRAVARRRHPDDAAVRDVAAGSRRPRRVVHRRGRSAARVHACSPVRPTAVPHSPSTGVDPGGGHVPWALQVVELRGPGQGRFRNSVTPPVYGGRYRLPLLIRSTIRR